MISLSAALIAILAKQWLNYLHAGLSPIPATRARYRQFRIEGTQKWRLPAVISFIPIMLHISLLLFFVGLVEFVWPLNEAVAIFTSILVCTTAAVYFGANILAYVYTDCPYKTSATVFVSQVLSRLAKLVRNVCLAAVLTWTSLSIRCRAFLHALVRYRDHSSQSAPLGIPLASVRRVDTFVPLRQARSFQSLRLLSFRGHEDQHISRNTETLDAHILQWLLRHRHHLSSLDQLHRSIISFPDLVRHRRLFIADGVYEFLEQRLALMYPVDISFTGLPSEKREGVTAIMRALAFLHTEADVDGPEYLENVRDDGLPRVTRLPPCVTLRSRPSTTTSASPSLSALLKRLLSDSEASPLPVGMAAYILRLAATINLREVLSPDRISRERVAETFLHHLGLIPSSPFAPFHPPTSPEEYLHAINSIIHFALHDIADPCREGTSHAVRYWLDNFTNITIRVPLDSAARIRIFWAICVLAWALHYQNDYSTVRPRIPRLSSVQPLLTPLAELLDVNQDPAVVTAVVIALDQMLLTRASGRLGARNEAERSTRDALWTTLRTAYPRFVGQLCDKLSKGAVGSDAAFERYLVPFARIALHLSFGQSGLHPHDVEQLRSLPATVLRIFQYILPPNPTATRPHYDTSHLPTVDPPHQSRRSNISRNELRGWVYRAASRFVELSCGAPKSPGDQYPLMSSELVYEDIRSSETVARGYVIAMQAISASIQARGPDDSSEIRMAFGAFTEHLFYAALSKPADDVEDWARPLLVMVLEERGLQRMLSATADLSQGGPLNIAAHVLHYIIYTDTLRRPLATEPRSYGVNIDVGASRIIKALAYAYPDFLERLEGRLLKGEMLERQTHMEIISISGLLLICYQYPRHSGDPSSPPPIDLDLVDQVLAFFSVCLSLPNSSRTLSGPQMQGLGTSPPWGQFAGVPPTRSELGGLSMVLPEDNPRHTHAFRVNPEAVAVKLVRILAVLGDSVVPMTDQKEHVGCERCRITGEEAKVLRGKLSGLRDPMGKLLLEGMVRIVIWTLHVMWGGKGSVFGSLRRELLEHNLAFRLRCFQRRRDEVGVVANMIALRLKGTELHRRGTPLRLLQGCSAGHTVT